MTITKINADLIKQGKTQGWVLRDWAMMAGYNPDDEADSQRYLDAMVAEIRSAFAAAGSVADVKALVTDKAAGIRWLALVRPADWATIQAETSKRLGL